MSFVVRLHLSPSDDPRRVNLDLIALPVKITAAKRLPSPELFKSGGGYPALLVKEGSKHPTRICPAVNEEVKPFGLPAWPLLLMAWDETVFPGLEYIVQAIRKMWHGATMPPIIQAEDWWRLNKGSKVAESCIPASPEWPLLHIDGPEPIEGDQGKQKVLQYYFLGTVESFNSQGGGLS